MFYVFKLRIVLEKVAFSFIYILTFNFTLISALEKKVDNVFNGSVFVRYCVRLLCAYCALSGDTA